MSGAACPRTSRGTPHSTMGLGLADLEHREEGVLGHLDAPDLLHALLALLLALEQLALAADVAAVALGGHVLAVGLDRLARDDVRADGGLDRHVVLLARDARAESLRERARRGRPLLAAHPPTQRLDGVARAQGVALDH